MTIIVSKNGKGAEKVEQSDFTLEDRLQEYIYDNPDTIPLYEIDEDTRLFIAAREFGTKSGPIDALGFDARGNIYIVETKLYKNPDKRTVVAQALDYGASLWRHSVDFDSFVRQLDAYTQKQFEAPFQEKYADFFGLEDATESMQSIRSNLAEGAIKFVVLMDRLHDALKDLVVYVNQNSKFDLYAVELEYYKHREFEIIIPKLYGSEVKKDVTSAKGSGSRRQWNEATFIESVENDAARAPAVLRLYEAGKRLSDSVRWGTGQVGSANFVFDHINTRSVFTLGAQGDIGLNYGWLSKSEPGGNDETEAYRDALRLGLEEAGFKTATGSSGFWHTLKYEDWYERVDELVLLLEKVLSKRRGV